MTTGITSYLANNWLNLLRGTAFTAPSGLYVKLHVGDPGASGTANASAVTGRIQGTFAAAAGGAISLSSMASQFAMSATETISHISVWDAAAGGNCLWTAALGAPRAVQSGDQLNLTGATLTLSGIAA